MHSKEFQPALENCIGLSSYISWAFMYYFFVVFHLLLSICIEYTYSSFHSENFLTRFWHGNQTYLTEVHMQFRV